jgi:hypothetical protein
MPAKLSPDFSCGSRPGSHYTFAHEKSGLVSQALQVRPELTAVKAVVEKELLHHDILREMSAAGLLGGG